MMPCLTEDLPLSQHPAETARYRVLCSSIVTTNRVSSLISGAVFVVFRTPVRLLFRAILLVDVLAFTARSSVAVHAGDRTSFSPAGCCGAGLV